MNDEYLTAFIRESQENIVDLNNSLLDLEADPDDREAMDLIFRNAHTLKGNFAAMGYEEPSRLAHAIEDLLDEIRQGRLAVSADVMDLVFDGVDQIETCIEEIEAEGKSTSDPTSIVERIRTVIEDGDQVAGAEERPRETSDDFEYDVDDPVYRAHVELTPSEMPGVDAVLILESFPETVEILDTVPDREAIEAGRFDREFDVDLTAAVEPEALEAEIESIQQVAEVTVRDLTSVTDPDAVSDSAPAESDRTSEDGSAAASQGSASSIHSVRVDVERLDELYNLVEQLVTSRIKLRRSVEQGGSKAASENLDELDKITSSLQNTVMDMRLIPLSQVVNTFPRLVRDLARDQQKEIDFSMTGTEVELDRTILTELSDPLMHILRNAVDHGIEPPDEREAQGKPREGTIQLSAKRERDHVVIEVVDDGAGLDVDAIRAKAVEQGLYEADELEAMDDSAIYDLVFHPGFSTAEEVTDVSGRGVGMDVVHSTINQLDGSIHVDSEPGDGTSVRLRLPVTMAIVRVLFVEVGGREYGLPLKDIDEITRLTGTKQVLENEVIDHDDTIYPVIDLHETLAQGRIESNGDGMLIRIREAERPVALACDGVRHQEEVVIKPFEGGLRDTPGLSGTAVIGDGNVVPIIDVETLAGTAG